MGQGERQGGGAAGRAGRAIPTWSPRCKPASIAINQQFAQVEQIKRFTLIGEEWLPDSDMLTPTSKLKRRGVHAHYAAQIEEMYADSQ